MKTALANLRNLAAAGMSGELVCVGGTCELHVFLQAGRIAWATDSSAPFAFARHLIEHTTLTNETFQEVLESCRRDRLPLGETLIEWQLATLQEIRAALSHQVRGALATLASDHDASSVFLERGRQYASYDVRLTFALDEVLSPARAPAVDLDAVLQRIAAQVAEASWLELCDGKRSLARHGSASDAEIAPALHAASIDDGAETVIVRTARSTYLGTRVGRFAHSLWCRLEPEAAFGATLATLQSALDWSPILAEPPVDEIGARSGVRPASLREVEPGASIQRIGMEPLTSSLSSFLAGVPEVVAAMVVGAGGTATAFRSGWDPTRLGELVRRRSALLASSSSSEGRASALESLGYRLRSIATAEAHLWCFGAELGGTEGRTAWLFLERSSTHALGWAYLASLRRQVEGTAPQQEEGWNKVG